MTTINTDWEDLIKAAATQTAEDENEKDGHCGPYGTSTWKDYEEETREYFEIIGRIFMQKLAKEYRR